MTILLKNVYIADQKSNYHGLTKDIFIENGVIKAINNNIAEPAQTIIEGNNLVASPGFIDVFASFNDPGFEYRETIETAAAAAFAGGYTQVLTTPHTQPIIQSKAQVEYIVQKSKQLPVTIHPIGAVSKNTEGKDLAEMYDMFNSGAKAFSDGIVPVQSAGLMLKALQYVKAFNGVVIQLPIDKSITAHGLMNEGVTSTRLGLPGMPAIAEELLIQRDIELLKYTSSKLHITGVSTAKSISLIQQAKQQGLNISCSVTPYHLFFCDEDLQEYDTNLKVNTPLRTQADMLALREAVVNGVVDCIATHHLPYNTDEKVCEFEAAKFGMIGLQTAFAVVNEVLPQLNATQLANLFGANAAEIFALPQNTITEGSKANITIFSQKQSSVLTLANNKSKSINSPFFNRELSGKIVATIHHQSSHIN